MIAFTMRSPQTVAGGWGFHRLFTRWLTQREIPWSWSTRDATSVLVNGWQASIWTVAYARARGLRIVHRVDGSGAAYGRKDGRKVDRRMRMLNKLADVTIYQSKYSRRVLGPMGIQDGPVIYNPVDLEMFSPAPPRWDKVRPSVAVVAWSGNPMKGLDQTAAIMGANTHVDFSVFGPYPLVEAQHVHWYGMVGHDTLGAALRRCDALLTLSRREAGPNHVIEALAAGVPVIYDGGEDNSIPEIVGDGGLSIGGSFRLAFDFMALAHDRYRKAARLRAETHHSPDIAFPRYVSYLLGK